MIDLDNSGHIAFGSPDAGGVEFPPEGALCTVLVSWDGGAKIKKAEAPGKNAANSTFTGTKVAEADVTIGWADVDPTAPLMLAAMLTVSPHGANKGKAWDVTERFAGVYDVAAVMVEDMKLKPTMGSDEMTLTLKLSGWTKPTNTGTGVGATPLSAIKYAVDGGALGAAGVVFHGSNAAELLAQQQQAVNPAAAAGASAIAIGQTLANLPKVSP